MRAVALVLTVLIALYVVACVVALGVGLVGVYGGTSEPLAMVFAILLAMPWSVAIGSVGEDAGPAGSFALLVLFMAINVGVLWFVRRLLRRTAA